MNITPLFVAQNTAVVLGIYAVCWILTRIGRRLFGWGAIILFCIGQFGWALLIFWVWCIAEREHRRDLALDRAAGAFNGPWID